jgi:hypothetical protein
MLYVRQISTPAGTTKDNATTTTIKAWSGVITRIEARFPPGPQFLLHVSVSQGGHQIYPVDDKYDVAGDDETVVADEFTEMRGGWNALSIKTWNDDATYAHQVVVRITVLPREIASPYDALKTIAVSLQFLLRRIGIKV